MKKAKDIITEINLFTPQDGNWLGLESMLTELWETGEQQKYLADLLRVFERFPDDDGAGVFWSIVHEVERFPDYEKTLVDSFNRQPSEMGQIMLTRIRNAHEKKRDGNT